MGVEPSTKAYIVLTPTEYVAQFAPAQQEMTNDSSLLRIISMIILSMMTLLAPWFFGSVSALATGLLLLGCILLVCIWWYRILFEKDTKPSFPVSVSPVLLAIGLGLFQLVPLPASLLQLTVPDQQTLREDVGWIPSAESAKQQAFSEPGVNRHADRIDVTLTQLRPEQTVLRTSTGRHVYPTPSQDSETTNDEESSQQRSTPSLHENSHWTQSGFDAIKPAHPQRGGHPVSANTNATKRDLTLLVMAAIVFSISHLCIRRQWLTWLLTAITANGVLLALFGMVQRFTWNDKHFWFIPYIEGDPFASFVNANNAGGYLNLCFAASLGLLLLLFHRSKTDEDQIDYSQSSFHSQGPAGELRERFFQFVSDLTIPKLIGITACVIIATGLFFSYSRGAILAAALAAMLTSLAMLLSPKYRLVGLAIGIMLALSFGGVALLGEGNTLQSELASVSGDINEDHDRVRLMSDLSPALSQHWRVGSGLGSFRYIYRTYRPETNDKWFFHADNHYLESWIDGGLPAALLILATIVIGVGASLLLIRNKTDVTFAAIGLTTIFAIGSQVIHGAFDYGLYIPSNLLLFSLILGAATGLAERLRRAVFEARKQKDRLQRLGVVSSANRADRKESRKEPDQPIDSRLHQSRLFFDRHQRWALPFGLFAIACFLVPSTYYRWQLDGAIETAQKALADPIPRSIDEVDRAIEELAPIAEKSGDESGYRYLGELFIRRYRILRTAELVYELNFAAQPNSWERKYRHTDLSILQGQVQQSYQQFGEAGLVRPRDDSRELIPALEAYRSAFKACPLVATTQIRLGQLSFLYESPSESPEYAASAVRLAPGRADILVQAATLSAQASRLVQASEYWRRCMQLSEEYHEAVLIDALGLFNYEEVGASILPRNPSQLIRLHARIEDFRLPPVSKSEVKKCIEDKTAELLAEQQVTDSMQIDLNSFLFWSRILEARNQRDEAVRVLQIAIGRQSDFAEARFQLAQLYVQQEKLELARDEANICSWLDPNDSRYSKLVDEIKELLEPDSQPDEPHSDQDQQEPSSRTNGPSLRDEEQLVLGSGWQCKRRIHTFQTKTIEKGRFDHGSTSLARRYVLGSKNATTSPVSLPRLRMILLPTDPALPGTILRLVSL